MSGWITQEGPQNEIVISSRVRLARNIAYTPFPAYLDTEEANKLIDNVYRAAKKKEDHAYTLYAIDKMPQTERQILLEKHLISPDLVKSSKGAALISGDEMISIMINEEDHIRIQSILPGFQVNKAWSIANEVDDVLEEALDYTYDEKLGYLTCCPTNVGTGMRASAMIHLPALNMIGNISKILQAVTQIGLTIRGLYGEGTEFLGNLFQISNQITLGLSEEEIVGNINAVTSQIVEKEREARNILLNNNRIQLEDKFWRSWGILKNARVMTSQEAMKLLSDIRLGMDLNFIENLTVPLLNEIMIETQPASIQKYAGEELTPEARDIIRAEIIRGKL
ncbi:protein arginine kinase [Lutispora saccharofermentans]|uniref:Protein-arginine kinase n=2 Tax=root TaxID=1 RepID=A0ABT1NL16_9FIRM|nr:protein arginine kinase [Lutispora saccharofermentans]MCQ1530976.1 protein arginine kinase [Lutispora saccharofermentans]